MVVIIVVVVGTEIMGIEIGRTISILNLTRKDSPA